MLSAGEAVKLRSIRSRGRRRALRRTLRAYESERTDLAALHRHVNDPRATDLPAYHASHDPVGSPSQLSSSIFVVRNLISSKHIQFRSIEKYTNRSDAM